MFIGIYICTTITEQSILPEHLADLLDFCSMQYGNEVVLGDFNLTPNNPIMLDFLNYYDFTNLIKRNACFKGDGSYIDLILTN